MTPAFANMSTTPVFPTSYPQGRFPDRSKVANFNAGPSGLPHDVMLQIQHDILNWNNYGMSIMDTSKPPQKRSGEGQFSGFGSSGSENAFVLCRMSHRSKEFDFILNEAQDNLRKVLNIPASYKIVFLQGGGHGQFSSVPLNLLKDKQQKCDYIVTGAWSKKAVQEAQRLCDPGSVTICHSTEAEKFLRVPTDNEISKVSEGSKYVYYCTNETVNGVEFHHVPKTPEGVALVADMSSDFLSRPVLVEKFGVIWAGAQKNAGISGVTTVIIHESLLNQARPDVPVSMHYKPNVEFNSCLNTPSTFGIYVSGLVFKWILAQGGLEEIERRNVAKSQLLYKCIDESDGFYNCPIQPDSRSRMNIVFRIRGGEAVEKKFAKEAEAEGMVGLEGHRSVGGMRSSLYNAVTLADVERLVAFMKNFQSAN